MTRENSPVRSPDAVNATGSGSSMSPSIRPMGSTPQIGSSANPKSNDTSPGEPPKPKIQAFQQALGAKRHEDQWKRSPNSTGTGAIHCKSFHCKLSEDALAFLDEQVNQWLDAHPQYEVKMVGTSVGDFAGKLGKEPHLIMQVWV